MTVLAADIDRLVTGGWAGSRLPLYASQAPFVGSLMTWDSSGYLKTLTAGYPFAGVSTQRILAADWIKATPANGDILHNLITGRFFMKIYLASGIAVTNPLCGLPVYASDDATFTLTASGNTYIGKICAYLDSTHAVIECETSDVRADAPGSMGVQAYATGAQTIASFDYNKLIIATLSGASTYTLPAVAGLVGKFFSFQSVTTDVLTVAANGSEKIGCAASVAGTAAVGAGITVLGTGVTGSEWVVVGKF
jgi:hypothetical protein